MANLNKVFLIGNLTRDPELRYAPSGTAVVSFGLATNRNYTTQTGEKKQETCFVRITVWGRQAEVCNQYLTKGSAVFVEGRLQYRTWEVNGQKRSALDVRADRVQFLSRVKGTGEVVEPQFADVDSQNEYFAGKSDFPPQPQKKDLQEDDLPPDFLSDDTKGPQQENLGG